MKNLVGLVAVSSCFFLMTSAHAMNAGALAGALVGGYLASGHGFGFSSGGMNSTSSSYSSSQSPSAPVPRVKTRAEIDQTYYDYFDRQIQNCASPENILAESGRLRQKSSRVSFHA